MRPILVALVLPLALAACGGGGIAHGEDQRQSHPVAVERSVSTLRLAADGHGHIQEVPAALRAFVTRHARRGHGPMEVRGTPADVAAVLRLAVEAGMRADQLLPNLGEPEAREVVLRFDDFTAHPPECGAFASDTGSLLANPHNRVSSEWGCSSQRNLGLMIFDPADLVQMRGISVPGASGRYVGRILDYGTYQPPPGPGVSTATGN